LGWQWPNGWIRDGLAGTHITGGRAERACSHLAVEAAQHIWPTSHKPDFSATGPARSAGPHL